MAPIKGAVFVSELSTFKGRHGHPFFLVCMVIYELTSVDRSASENEGG